MNKLLTYFLVSLGILGLAGAGIASAYGWFGNLSPEDLVAKFETMFQKKAEILGISVEDYKDGWAEGKTLKEIAEEQGITQEQFQERMMQEKEERMRERLNTLVENGVITQEQADQKLNFMQERFENMISGESFGGCHHMKGWGMGF